MLKRPLCLLSVNARKMSDSLTLTKKIDIHEPSDEVKPTNADANALNETGREPLFLRRKKFAVLFGYCGANYFGLQWNDENLTVEKQVIQALADAKITPPTALHPSELQLQRCARTDKGVSAAANLLSLVINQDQEDIVERLNKLLPHDIKTFAVIRTSKGFNAKNFCASRTYSYLMPTFAFAPIDAIVSQDYRITDEILEHANELFSKYVGTKNFHNFTRDIKAWQPQAKRYIMSCKLGSAFERDGMQFVELRIRGQSFMMHQIRKMVGLIISIMRGYTTEEAMTNAFGAFLVNVPKAPALGLMLQTVHMDI